MIGIDGQYLFVFVTQDKEDFISPNDLIKFTLTEEGGGYLPTFQLNFRCSDVEGENFKEGAEIHVGFGQSFDSLDHAILTITRIRRYTEGQGRYIYMLTGTLYSNSTTMMSKYYISKEKEDFGSVVKELWPNKVNIEKGEEERIWINTNKTILRFIRDNYLHVRYTEGFPVCYVGLDNSLNILEMKKESEVEWFFSNYSNGIRYRTEGLPDFTNQAQMLVKGGKYSYLDYNIEKLIEKLTPIQPKSCMPTKPFEIENNLRYGTEYSNEYLTSEEIKNYNQNLSNNRFMYGVNFKIVIEQSYLNYKLFDYCVIEEPEVLQGVMSVSGLYFINRINRILTEQSFMTILDIHRGGR